MHVTAIVLAAGAGRRIGADVSKTYLSIAGRPLILRALDRMFAAKAVKEVILVVAENNLHRCDSMLRGDAALSNRPWVLQSGGSTRQQSARRGLEKLNAV